MDKEEIKNEFDNIKFRFAVLDNNYKGLIATCEMISQVTKEIETSINNLKTVIIEKENKMP